MTPDVDFSRTTRQILAVCAVLTLAGTAWFAFNGGTRPLASFLFGAVVSVSLLGMLARTLALLDVTGTESTNASGSTKASLFVGQLLMFPIVGLVLTRYEVDVNAAAAGFGVAVLGATLQQAFTLLVARK